MIVYFVMFVDSLLERSLEMNWHLRTPANILEITILHHLGIKLLQKQLYDFLLLHLLRLAALPPPPLQNQVAQPLQLPPILLP